MKKIIIIALAVLLCGTAYASKLEVSGDLFYRGEIRNNYNLKADDATSKSAYDMEMNIAPKFVVDENTYAYANFEIRDMTAGTDQEDDSSKNDHYDDNIYVEYAYLSTKVGPSQISVGLMEGGAWGTVFGDSTTGTWRVKAVTTTPVGALVTVLQKNSENSTDDVNGSDDDVYYLGFITKAGPMMVKPLLVYANLNAKAAEKTAFVLAADGSFGDISIETEFGYQSVDADNDNNDYSLIGFYLHASMKMGDNAAGLVVLYGGTDELDAGITKGYQFGDDQDFTAIIDGDLEVGGTEGIGGAGGFTVVAAYFSMKLMENKLTVTPKLAYFMSNYDEDDVVMNSDNTKEVLKNVESAIEFDLDCSYKINDAVTYSFGAAYATISVDDTPSSNEDPDPVYLLYHKMKISF